MMYYAQVCDRQSGNLSQSRVYSSRRDLEDALRRQGMEHDGDYWRNDKWIARIREIGGGRK